MTAGAVARRAVVLFLPPPVGVLVDEIRRRWDPVMASRIDPHLTLVHDVADHESANATAVGAAGDFTPFDVTLTTAACWGRPERGVYLEVDDPSGSVRALHDRFAGLERPAWVSAGFRPHVTLVHGRTVDPGRAAQAWSDLNGRRVDWVARIGTVDVIELDETTGWSVVDRHPLGRRARQGVR